MNQTLLRLRTWISSRTELDKERVATASLAIAIGTSVGLFALAKKRQADLMRRLSTLPSYRGYGPPPEKVIAGEVPAVLTPANASQVAAAILQAMKEMGRKPVRQESWLYPLAVSQFETDVPPRSWRQLYNYNVGNVTGGKSWYTNPHVGKSYKFHAYGSLLEGARGMLGVMQHIGALDAADRGDMDSFCKAMVPYSSGYASAASGLQKIANNLRGTSLPYAYA
jgi:hypothetical protein